MNILYACFDYAFFYLQIIKVNLDETEMDSLIFFLANKKVCAKIHKEMNDLSLYCGDRKSGHHTLVVTRL